MKTDKTFSQLIANKSDAKAIPALQLVKSSPEVAAMISKLVRSREPNVIDSTRRSTNSLIDRGALTEISNSIKSASTDAENMLQLFPDMELSAQILISAVISPKDMTNTDIIYKIEDGFLPPDITTSLITTVKEHCELYYDITKMLPIMLRDVLFDTGSYPMAIIPESSVDELINGRVAASLESISEIVDRDGKTTALGFLGSPNKKPIIKKPSKISLESFTNTLHDNSYHQESIYFDDASIKEGGAKAFEYLSVSDNFKLLKLPAIIANNNRIKVKSKLRSQFIATEASSNNTYMERTIYKPADTHMNPFVTIKTQSSAYRKSVGMPLVMKLPSEAVIPVHVPGDEKNHIGYFLLLDEEGNPVSKNSSSRYMGDLESHIADPGNAMSSFLMKRAKTNLAGNENKALTLTQASRIYSDIVEADLLERLKNGAYGTSVMIGKNEEVFRIMLARTFSNQYTKLVYIPAELVTYFAYKYNANGVGKSLLEDMRILNSLRAMLMFSRVMASLKNSIGITEVKLKLDEADPDPKKTMETAVHEIMRTRQQTFPIGINAPGDIAEWVQSCGLEFSFEGHPDIPDMAFEFNNKGASTVVPDNDLDEELKKRTIMAMGMSPETVDNGFAAEFATTVVRNNILLSKRVMQIQEQIMPQFTDYTQKLITNDLILFNKLKDIIKAAKDAAYKFLTDEQRTEFADDTDGLNIFIVNEFSNKLVLSLPNPSSTTLDNQIEGFDAYIEALDKCLEAWISAELLNSEFAGDIGNSADAIKTVVRAHFIRKYLADNNILPELSDLTAQDIDGKPMLDLFDTQKAHITGLIRSSVRFIKGMSAMKEAANKDLANMGVDAAPSEPSDSTDNNGGDDPFGMGDDGSMDDATVDDGVSDTTDADAKVNDTDTKDDVQEDTKDKTDDKPIE